MHNWYVTASLSKKALNFPITAAQDQWSEMQNSVTNPLIIFWIENYPPPAVLKNKKN